MPGWVDSARVCSYLIKPLTTKHYTILCHRMQKKWLRVHVSGEDTRPESNVRKYDMIGRLFHGVHFSMA